MNTGSEMLVDDLVFDDSDIINETRTGWQIQRDSYGELAAFMLVDAVVKWCDTVEESVGGCPDCIGQTRCE